MLSGRYRVYRLILQHNVREFGAEVKFIDTHLLCDGVQRCSFLIVSISKSRFSMTGSLLLENHVQLIIVSNDDTSCCRLREHSHLKSLLLRDNNFAEGLPDVIGQLTSLNVLDLRSCSLKNIPSR